MTRIGIPFVLLFSFFLLSCVTAGKPDTQGDVSQAERDTTVAEEGGEAAQDEDAEQQIFEFLENAQDNLFQGKVAEAIKQLVSVLAAYEDLVSPSARAQDLASRAETELTKMEAAIAIEPDAAWLDDAMMQKFGTTLDLSLQPAVMITYRGETGRTLVSNVPISFEFVAGSGILTAVVNTDEYGTASCNIARIDSTQEENIIRASLAFRTQGYTYRFKGVERDFIYRPPTRKATILVLERSPLGVSDDPFILDPVFNRMKELEFDFSLYNGVLSPDNFMRVYEGELSAIGTLGLSGDVSYLVVVLNDSYSVRQLELDGKKYNIYVSEARATTRIVRVGDGKIMFQVAVERSKRDSNHGQGGSEEKAVWDVQDKISSDMAEVIKNNFSEIREVMLGDEE